MTQFGRIAVLDIESTGADAVRIRDLRISFDIEKSRTMSTNRACIRVYNLSKTTRGKIKETDALIRLQAGYEQGAGLAQLFQGEIQRIVHKRDGVDIITIMESQDGAKQLRQVRITASFSPGTSAATAVQDIAGRIGLPVRMFVTPKGSLSDGFAFAGPAKDALDQICRRFNLEWSIQDGTIHIVAASGTTGDIAVVLSPQTGLIGNPERINYVQGELLGTPKQRAKKAAKIATEPEWRLRSLLEPKLVPAGIVRVQSMDISGDFSIETLKHNGDTRGQDFVSEIEVKSIV